MKENNVENIRLFFSIFIAIVLFLNIFTSFSFSKTINTEDIDKVSSTDSFSWRDVEEMDFSTPVKNQEYCKSSASFALIACLETMVQYNVSYPFHCDLSEAHLFFNNNGTCDNGVNISACADYLKNLGVPDEGCFPYPEKYCSIPDYTNISNWEMRAVKTSDWGWVDNKIESIKEAITTHGPVVALINYSSSFLNYKGGIYRPKDKIIGIQWVSIFGYNDDPGYWICKNSWGKEWGEYGWFKMPYNSDMITNGKYLDHEHISNECTGVLFLNGTLGNLTPDVPIVEIFQPSRGFIYTSFSQYTKRSLRSNLFTEYFLYILRNSLFNRIFKNRFVDIRTPWVINSCMIEVCAVRYTGNTSVYIDNELKYNFTRTTFYNRIYVDTPGLHTLKAVAYNENGDMSFDTRDFLVIL